MSKVYSSWRRNVLFYALWTRALPGGCSQRPPPTTVSKQCPHLAFTAERSGPGCGGLGWKFLLVVAPCRSWRTRVLWLRPLPATFSSRLWAQLSRKPACLSELCGSSRSSNTPWDKFKYIFNKIALFVKNNAYQKNGIISQQDYIFDAYFFLQWYFLNQFSFACYHDARSCFRLDLMDEPWVTDCTIALAR